MGLGSALILALMLALLVALLLVRALVLIVLVSAFSIAPCVVVLTLVLKGKRLLPPVPAIPAATATTAAAATAGGETVVMGGEVEAAASPRTHTPELTTNITTTDTNMVGRRR